MIHVAYRWETRNDYKSLDGKSLGRAPLWENRSQWEDRISVTVRVRNCGDVDCKTWRERKMQIRMGKLNRKKNVKGNITGLLLLPIYIDHWRWRLHKANLQVSPIEFEAGVVTRNVEAAKASAGSETTATSLSSAVCNDYLKSVLCVSRYMLKYCHHFTRSGQGGRGIW